MVITENAKAVYGLIPLINMWCPHTMKPSKPIDSMAYTIALYPKMGLRENTETNSEHNPSAGRIPSYTTGSPKNQNRCCHKSGEPPLCAASCPFTTTSDTKK